MKNKQDIKTIAKAYLKKLGWNIIPVKKNKKPFFKWEPYQKKIVTTEEIEEWWTQYPNANIAVITGNISNISVIDIDTAEGIKIIQEYIPENIEMPIAKTQSNGYHYFFRCPKNNISNNTRIIDGCDFRANGGYVILPPSIGEKGIYKWQVKPSTVEIPDLPQKYVNKIKSSNTYILNCKNDAVNNLNVTNSYEKLHNVTLFQDGRRDEDLFHCANTLHRGGMKNDNIQQVMRILAMNCNPPFSENEVKVKIGSAIKRAEKKEHNWQQELTEWVMLQNGYWKVTDCYNELQSVTKQDKGTVRVVIKRLMDSGIIEHHPKTSGVYRKLEIDLEEIDYMNAPTEAMDFKLPLNISRYADAYSGNIIIIAGSKDSGKTAFVLNVAMLNKANHKINYFSSEMAETELKVRLKAFEKCHNIPLESWRENCKFYLRAGNFGDVTKPGEINIYDYMELSGTDDMTGVGGFITDIWKKLNGTGLGIIAMQKDRGRDTARGGSATAEKSRIYIALENGTARIVSAKNRTISDVNPNGMELTFKLVQGCKFIIEEDWHKNDVL